MIGEPDPPEPVHGDLEVDAGEAEVEHLVLPLRAALVEEILELGRIGVLLRDARAHGDGIARDRDSEHPRPRPRRVVGPAEAGAVGAIERSPPAPAGVGTHEIAHGLQLRQGLDAAAVAALWRPALALPARPGRLGLRPSGRGVQIRGGSEPELGDRQREGEAGQHQEQELGGREQPGRDASHLRVDGIRSGRSPGSPRQRGVPHSPSAGSTSSR